MITRTEFLERLRGTPAARLAVTEESLGWSRGLVAEAVTKVLSQDLPPDPVTPGALHVQSCSDEVPSTCRVLASVSA